MLTPERSAWQSVRFEANASVVALKIGGWSKAVGVVGSRNSDYSIYVDIRYTDGTPLYGQVASFETGTHDWSYSSILVKLGKPIQSLTCYLLLRREHSAGTVWFDDITIQQYTAPTFTTDSIVELSPGLYQQTATSYSSRLVVNYTAKADHIRVDGHLRNLKTPLGNRAVTLEFSLPLAATVGWTWGSGMKTAPLGNFSGGQTNHYIRPATLNHDLYPLAAVSDDNAGIAIGASLETYYPFRFGYNGMEQLLSIEMDFALTPFAHDANAASLSFVFFKLDKPTSRWPWRSG